MSSVKSWEISDSVLHRPGPGPGLGPGPGVGPGPGPGPGPLFHDLRTTGYFPAPEDEGIPTNLTIYLSSFSDVIRQVTVQVNRLVNGRPEAIFSRTLEIPAGEGRRLEVEDVAGETLEVRVRAADDVLPSADLAYYFVADGGIVVQEYRSPADFVRV